MQLGFVAVLGAGLAALLFYEQERVGQSDRLFFEALGAILIAALLFIVTLPTFQRRVSNITLLMVALLSGIALGAAFFAGGAEQLIPPMAVPPEATENTARQIKGGVYIEMEDIGHFPMSENYPLFRVYLKEALRIIKERKG